MCVFQSLRFENVMKDFSMLGELLLDDFAFFLVVSVWIINTIACKMI